MMVWVWVALGGATFVAAILFSLRLRRRGTVTLEDDRVRSQERIRQTEEEIWEEQNRMTVGEHLCIARAGIEDLLQLAGYGPDSSAVQVVQQSVCDAELVLTLSGERLCITLSKRECQLAGGKMVRSRTVWHLYDGEQNKEFVDLASLMRALSLRLGSALETAGEKHVAYGKESNAASDVPQELPHFARRFVHADKIRHGVAGHGMHARSNGRPQAMKKTSTA